MKKIFLILFSGNLISCGAHEFKPHVLDTQLAELREYRVIDKKNMIIEFVKGHPIEMGKNSYGNGFWCLSPEDIAEVKNQALKCSDKHGNVSSTKDGVE